MQTQIRHDDDDTDPTYDNDDHLKTMTMTMTHDHGNGDDKVFAGTISFHSLSVKNSVGELGYWMTASMRGKGIATTAARMLTDYGFATIGFKRIEGLVDRENVASLKLLESAGYQREGLLRKKIARDDGRQVDMYIYAALPEDWEYLPH